MGPWDPKDFRAQGWVAQGWVAGPRIGGTGPRQTRRILVGLVPDGVASVTLRLAGSSPEIPPSGTPPKSYTLHATVTDNVFFLPDVPEQIPQARPHRMTWRDARGRVMNVMHNL